MKRTVLGLVPVLLVLGLILAGCTSPIEPAGGALVRAVGGNSTLNAGFNPNDSYMTYGNQGEGYKGDGITTIMVKTSDVTYWADKTVYNFYLKNAAGDEFLSFCGNYNSGGLDEVELYGKLDTDKEKAIIGALNYINNEYGSINTWSCTDGSGNLASTLAADNTKLIAQFAIWLILDPNFDVMITQPGCDGIVAAAKAAVANPETGNISIYFLTGNDYPNDIHGIQPQIVPIVTKPSKPAVFTGDIKIEKTVDGINIAVWAEANKAAYGFSNLADLISFNIYKTTGEGQALGQLVATVSPDSAGNISVSNPGDGWYAVEEVLSPAGAKVFEQPAGVKYILIANGLQYGEVTGFDYDAQYHLNNGWGSGYRLFYGAGNQFLNNDGDIFPISVDANDVTYDSFCGNAGSASFANGYMIAQRMDRDSALYSDFVKAYNYIANKYGDLNAVRPVTQIVTWYLLGAIDINSDEFTNIRWDLVEAGTADVKGVPNAKDMVLDVIKNYKTYKGLAKIVDVVYMVDASDPTPAGYHDGQPQYVPIYSGESEFKNAALQPPPPKPPKPPVVKGDISIEKTVDGINIAAKYSQTEISGLIRTFELYQVNANGASIVGLAPIAYANPDSQGKLVFTGLAKGWYAINEVLTDAGKLVFEQAPVMYIYIGADGSSQIGSDFDPDASYYADYNGWVQAGGSVPLYTKFAGGVVWDGVKTGTGTAADGQVNEVQKITLRTARWGDDFDEYPSFCAHVGSWAYSGNSYEPYGLDLSGAKIISAFNYIFDTYGSLDGWCEGADYQGSVGTTATRVLAQMAVWYFLPPDTDAFKVTEIYVKDPRYTEINAAFAGVIAAADAGYKGSGRVSLVYLADSVNPGDVGNCQPQIVPIFDAGFYNTTKDDGNPCEKPDHKPGKYHGCKSSDKPGKSHDCKTNDKHDNNHDCKTNDKPGDNHDCKTNDKPGNNHDCKTNDKHDNNHNYKPGNKHDCKPGDDKPDEPLPPPPVLGPSYGSVTATNAGNVPAILAGLNPKNGNPYYGDKKADDTPFVVPNSNHFVFAEFSRTELEAGVTLDMVVGNKYDIVGSAFVQLVDGNIVITINGVGSFGAMAFNQLPVPNNGNIHSGKCDMAYGSLVKWSSNLKVDNSTVTIPCPAGNTIWLYIHGDFQFYM